MFIFGLSSYFTINVMKDDCTYGGSGRPRAGVGAGPPGASGRGGVSAFVCGRGSPGAGGRAWSVAGRPFPVGRTNRSPSSLFIVITILANPCSLGYHDLAFHSSDCGVSWIAQPPNAPLGVVRGRVGVGRFRSEPPRHFAEDQCFRYCVRSWQLSYRVGSGRTRSLAVRSCS